MFCSYVAFKDRRVSVHQRNCRVNCFCKWAHLSGGISYSTGSVVHQRHSGLFLSLLESCPVGIEVFKQFSQIVEGLFGFCSQISVCFSVSVVSSPICHDHLCLLLVFIPSAISKISNLKLYHFWINIRHHFWVSSFLHTCGKQGIRNHIWRDLSTTLYIRFMGSGDPILRTMKCQ